MGSTPKSETKVGTIRMATMTYAATVGMPTPIRMATAIREQHREQQHAARDADEQQCEFRRDAGRAEQIHDAADDDQDDRDGARMTAPRRIPWTVFFTCVTNSPPGPIPELSTIRWSGGMSTPVIIIATTVYSADVITVYWAIPRR